MAIPRNLRNQTKAIFFWYAKARVDLLIIYDKNIVLTDDELVIFKDLLNIPMQNEDGPTSEKSYGIS